MCMAIPYLTAKLKSANAFAMVIWDPTTKFNSCQYFQLYGIMGKRESILLHYGTVSQPFPGFMTFGVIYICLRYHSLLFVGMLASLYDIYNTTTVTTAGMQCTGTNCEITLFVNIITKVMNPVKCCSTVPWWSRILSLLYYNIPPIIILITTYSEMLIMWSSTSIISIQFELPSELLLLCRRSHCSHVALL